MSLQSSVKVMGFSKSIKRVDAKAPKKYKLLFITIVAIKLFDYKQPKPNKLLI